LDGDLFFRDQVGDFSAQYLIGLIVVLTS